MGKNLISVVLSITLFALIPSSLTVKAFNSATMSVRYSYIASLDVDCTCKNDIATCYGNIIPWDEQHGSQLSITLQEFESGKWKNLKTWNDGNSKGSTSITRKYAVSATGTYRIKVTGKILSVDGTVLESQTIYGYTK